MVVVDDSYFCEFCRKKLPNIDTYLRHITRHAEEQQLKNKAKIKDSTPRREKLLGRIMRKFGGQKKMEDEENNSMDEEEIKLMREFMQNSDARFEEIEKILHNLDRTFKGMPSEVLQDVNKIPRQPINPGEKVQEIVIHTTQKHIGKLFELLNDNPDKFILKTNKMIATE